MAVTTRWRILIDTGGTFTDCLAVDPDGRTHRAKVLSSAALRGVVIDSRRTGADSSMGARVRIHGVHDARVVRGMVAQTDDGRTLGIVIEANGDLVRLRGAFTGPALHDGAAIDFNGRGDGAPLPAPILAAHVVTGTPVDTPLPPTEMRLATTRATNALLERRGARCALLVDEGFEDLLRIGDQRRPDLFARDIVLPAPITELVIGVPARVAADGTVLRALDDDACDTVDRRLRDASARRGPIETVAIALMHSWAHPDHERRLADFLRSRGWNAIILSSAIAPAIGILDRARTTAVEAFLRPIMRGHLHDVGAALGTSARLDVLTSAGGLVAAELFRAVDGLLSGPAGGVAGATAVARRLGIARVIAFDMGGTSTDVARIDGHTRHRDTHQVGGVTIVAPALAIETVAAGGGSICTFDGLRLAVGPRSAGADPGPACYGRGGPLTITDVNLLLGRLATDRFGIPTDGSAAERAADELWALVRAVRREVPDRRAMLEGLLELADERMADAIAAVSLRQGADPADYALVAFGGAGGMHACGVAQRLGIRRVVIPADAGLLSAVGLGAARVERVQSIHVLREVGDGSALRDALEAAEAAATAALRESLAAEAPIVVSQRIVRLRVVGQDACMELALDDRATRPRPEALADRPLELRFRAAYAALFRDEPPDGPLEIESVRVVVGEGDQPSQPIQSSHERDDDGGASASPMEALRWDVSRWSGVDHPTPIHRIDHGVGGRTLVGPALVLQAHGSVAVPPGWRGQITDDGTIDLEVASGAHVGANLRGAALETELIAARLMSVAEEMGELLRRTALSTNVRDRLDFSCGILDADGTLVANAPHVPVHLGALGPCVRAVAAVCRVSPGDVLVTNHPGCGGSHLPDVTVLTPIHLPTPSDRSGASDPPHLVGWLASRAHHAEIGGVRPGSMAPDARSLVEEGVVIPPMHLVERGEARFGRLAALLADGPFPSRAPERNLADIRAAVAANAHGERAMLDLATSLGADRLRRHMTALADHAAARCRGALRRLAEHVGDGVRELDERLDDGTPLRATVILHPRADDTAPLLTLRLGGDLHRGNLNATPAIALSVVMYVLRLLVDEPMPLNEGLLRPVRIILEPGLLAPQFPEDAAACPAVGGGNTETSQRLADLLVRALGIAAGSQGTMNNVAFGNQRFSHYETIGGGAGATASRDGADGVHTHMTNTRITDAEVIEHRMPVRIERWELRGGSGGAGRHRGGDGLRREIRFLEPASVSILTQRRIDGPPGSAGGAAGSPGRQWLLRDDRCVALDALCAIDVETGDRLLVETPGGGAWGPSENGHGDR